MSFNVSRFLVRVRQFWTRKRLVPVLGITAIFLFLLNFYTFLNRQFEDKPIIAFHAMGDHEGFHFEADGQENVYIFRQETENGVRIHRHRFEHELEHHFEHEFEHEMGELKRELEKLEHELKRDLELEKHREHIRKRLRIHKDGDEHRIIIRSHDGDELEERIWFKDDEGEDIRIEVNGSVVSINKVESEI